MMHDFLSNNRSDLIERCRIKVSRRPMRSATPLQLESGVPMFLDQLIRTLIVEQSSEPMDSRKISGPSGGGTALSEMGVTAAQHGRELLEMGFSIDQVVHDYGDLCQAITDLAFERDAPFLVDEFRTLNRCLDNAIADAVTEFSYQRETAVAIKKTREATDDAEEANERLGVFAHEMRNQLQTAIFAFGAARSGHLNLSGATGAVLERALDGLCTLIDRSLAEVRITNETALQRQVFSAADFIAEAKSIAMFSARALGCTFTVSPVDHELALMADRDLLLAALGNLLQNAFKFTHRHSEVTLNAYAVGERVAIDVIDHCGGLVAGAKEKMFLPFSQLGTNRGGLGLGLSIARRSVQINDGTLSVEDVPGVGCIFTINLPRYTVEKT